MSAFGERLRRQREMRGVSLEEISKSTKIGIRSLKAIEDEDFEKLPGGIFNKGFVRAYARFLGLDEEEIVADFEEAWNAFEAERNPQVLEVPEEEERPSSSRSVWSIVLLILIAAAAGAWYGYQRMRAAQAAAPQSTLPQIPAEASSRSTTNQNPPVSQDQPTPAPALPIQNGNSTHESEPAKPAQVVEGAKSTAKPEPSANKASASAAAALTGSVEAAPIRLRVFARADSWLSVSADGKDLGQGILSAQKTRSIRAQKEIRLKIGNIGGVEISFNGQPVDVDGQPQQVKELIFTAEGLQR